MDASLFLDKADRFQPQPVYVICGDEGLLRRLVLEALRERIFGKDSEPYGWNIQDGAKATFADVIDEVSTVGLFGPARVVVVDDADLFITDHRAQLEEYVQHPSTAGVLVLCPRSWPSNTRLAKMVPDASTIQCKAPASYQAASWCSRWARSRYEMELPSPAAQSLVELIGAELGILDQELAKLATFVGERKRIDETDVDRLVGNSRAESIWKIFEAIGAGKPTEALRLLERLFEQGEDPHRLLGAFSMQLRRLAQTARLQGQGLSLSAAMARLGVQPFAQRGIEPQLRHLGPSRLNWIYPWLLEVDLGMKGSSQLSEETLLERLVVRLARPPDERT